MAVDQLERLKRQLKELKLYAILNCFEEEAEKSAKTNLSYVEFLANLIQREVLDKTDRSVNRKINLARFPRLATLEEFDFNFQPGLNAREVRELSNLAFIEKKENIIFLGPPGVGKTHLAIALGIRACTSRYRVAFYTARDIVDYLYSSLADMSTAAKLEQLARIHLVIIDELGYLSMDRERASLFFQLVSKRYETGSIILTTNVPFTQWDSIFGDQVIASAILDRLAHHCHIFAINGHSYRMKDKLKQAKVEVSTN